MSNSNKLFVEQSNKVNSRLFKRFNSSRGLRLHIKKVRENISSSGWQLIEWDYESTGIKMK